MKNIRKIFLVFTLFFSIFIVLGTKPAFAALFEENTGDPCQTTPDCIKNGYGSTSSCKSAVEGGVKTCFIMSKSYASSLEKFQNELKECDKTGNMNLSCFIAGTGDVNPDGYQGIFGSLVSTMTLSISGPGSANLDQANGGGGAIGSISNLISGFYKNPPASGIQYVADLGRNLGIAKPVYAQGVGFSGLSNLLPLWKVTRNATYVLFILLFLIIGLSIMFRVKMSPQTVITIQSNIPKVVIGLLLVTFSYAIAGFLIDLIYLIIYLGIAILAPAAGLSIQGAQQEFINIGFGGAFKLIFNNGIEAVSTAINQGLFEGIINMEVGGLANQVISGVAGVVTTLILSIVALVLVFKLFLSLLLAYISIIVSVIFAPIQIALGILPGSKGGFGSWFNNMLSNVLIFPAVALTFFLGKVLVATSTTGAATGPTWSPPVLGVSGQAIVPVLALGVLLLSSKVPGMVKSMFKMKESSMGSDIFAPIKGAYGLYQKGGKAVYDESGYAKGRKAKKEAESKYRMDQVLQKSKGYPAPGSTP